jgi:bacterioferritin-associated ferredoxin
MIICVCNAVSDRQIRAAVRGGACSLRDLTRELRVGTCCGKCVPEARAALAAGLARETPSESVYFSAQTAEFAA